MSSGAHPRVNICYSDHILVFSEIIHDLGELLADKFFYASQQDVNQPVPVPSQFIMRKYGVVALNDAQKVQNRFKHYFISFSWRRKRSCWMSNTVQSKVSLLPNSPMLHLRRPSKSNLLPLQHPQDFIFHSSQVHYCQYRTQLVSTWIWCSALRDWRSASVGVLTHVRFTHIASKLFYSIILLFDSDAIILAEELVGADELFDRFGAFLASNHFLKSLQVSPNIVQKDPSNCFPCAPERENNASLKKSTTSLSIACVDLHNSRSTAASLLDAPIVNEQQKSNSSRNVDAPSSDVNPFELKANIEAPSTPPVQTRTLSTTSEVSYFFCLIRFL